MTEIIHKQDSYAMVGACFEVYNEKGCGFLEAVYQESLQIEFEYQRIPAIPKPCLTLSYRGRTLQQIYQPDFVCFGKIIVELKAASVLTDEHRAQLLNYLHATGFDSVCWSTLATIPVWNTNGSQRHAIRKRPRTRMTSPSNPFASIRVIRGQKR
jgi:GxxExxY protein